jgi:quercetin dioxygenase-like cupin family protein
MRRALNQPEETEIALYAGIFIKVYTVQDVGTLIPQHSHEHPHATLLMKGAIQAWRDGEYLGLLQAPAIIRIPAHTMHKFMTTVPDVRLACLHNADHLENGEPAVAAEHVLDMED